MTAARDFLPTALRGPYFEPRPKQVRVLKTFRDYTGKLKDPRYLIDFTEVVTRVSTGRHLPDQLYRAYINSTTDFLLQLTGVKHLHLGGQNSNVLLFAVEFPMEVALLEVNGHQRFDRNRVGELLMANHAISLNRVERAA
jgi:hypothetical protein